MARDNFESNMAANGYWINDSFVRQNLENVELDAPMNVYTSVRSDTFNNSLRKIEKYINLKIR